MPGNVAYHPNDVLLLAQVVEPIQHTVAEVSSTVLLVDVLSVKVCAVRLEGFIVKGEVNPVAAAVAVVSTEPLLLSTVRLRNCEDEMLFQVAKFQSQKAYRACAAEVS